MESVTPFLQPSPAPLFDRKALMAARRRGDLARHGFLYEENAKALMERLSFVKRPFLQALDLGSRGPWLAELLRRGNPDRQVFRASFGLAAGAHIAAGEEALPFAEGSFDLMTSNLALHWTNDLPGVLIQARRCLKPDGFFLASLFGGGTLAELRSCLAGAELELKGGAAPRVSPFLDVREGGALLQRAGFALPVAEREAVTLVYPDAFALMRELRGMGETNRLRSRARGLASRSLFFRAAEIYAQRFARGGGVAATFEIITLSGWSPDPCQQKPLKPGEGRMPLAEALDARAAGMDAGR